MSDTPLSLYIHWPFCLAKCPYCDFNSHVRNHIDPSRWIAGLIKEMRYWRAQTGSRTLGTIFFGGGTPSLIPPSDIEKLIREARALWTVAPDIEISMEANPTSSEAQKFRDFASAGVNRLSLGVQALDDASLKFLGREHTVAEAMRALEAAQTIFPRSSFDLIYARKGQTAAMWEAELQQALKVAGKHVSLYQLTIEPGTVFAQKTNSGAVFQAHDDESAIMYEMTYAMTKAAGLPAYEVSNHAAPGEACRHNLAYWHYHDYVGIGPGAHGRVPLNSIHTATSTYKPPEVWVRKVEEGEHGLEVIQPLSARDEIDEAFMMNLRLYEGIDKSAWFRRFGVSLDDVTATPKKQLLVNEGLVEDTPQRLRVTEKGMLRLTTITGMLMNDA